MTQHRRHRVAVVLVTHNGARWLPHFFHSLPAALRAPMGPGTAPDEADASQSPKNAVPAAAVTASGGGAPEVASGAHEQGAVGDSWLALWGEDEPATTGIVEDLQIDPVLIAVDTGSVDDSVELAQRAGFTVLSAESSTPFGRAASLARSYLEQQQIEVDWLWLVHDDMAPLPGCLPRLLLAAQETSAAVCGPLVVGWAQPPLLLERGIRLTGSGRRVLGVDPGEVDQGQHDDEPATPTLAVSSTAMLVRVDAWDALNGYDPAFPMSGDDIDFCRRAHRAGFEVVVVASAKVRHAQALTRNRRPESRSTRPVRDLRLAALHLHLAHATGWAFPLVAARLSIGTGVRAVARLLRRDFAGARDEIDGWLRFIAHPSRLVASRHRVAATAVTTHRVERAYSVPLREQGRHWLRSVVHLLEIITRVGERPHAQATFIESESEARPVRAEVWRRLVHRPQLLVPASVAAVLLLWHLPLLFSAQPLQGELLPGSGQGSFDVLQSYLSGWHDVGRGTTAAAPAWLVALAVLGVPLGGNVSAALSALFVFFPVLATIIVAAVARPIIQSPWVRTTVAISYALTPVFTHARDVGDFATLLCGLLLPVFVRVAWTAIETGHMSRYAATALVLAIACAFTAIVWFVVLLAAIAASLIFPAARTGRSFKGLALVLVGPWLVLLPSSLDWLRHPSVMLMSAGSIQDLGSQPPNVLSTVLTLSATQPQWWAVGLVLVAILAIARGGSHDFARNLGLFFLLAVLVLVALSRLSVRIPGFAGVTHANPSAVLIVLALVAALSIGTAADGLVESLRAQGLGLRHIVSACSALAVAASAGVGLWTWLAAPSSTLSRGVTSDLPAFVAADLTSDQRPRAITVQVDDPKPVTFAVRSAPTTRFGGADMLRVAHHDEVLDAAMGDLIAQGQQSTSTRTAAVLALVDSGVRYLALSAQGAGAPAVAATLIAVPGLRQLATPQAGQPWWVWQLPRQPARLRITELVGDGPSLAGQSPTLAMTSDVDPGRLELKASSTDPALGPATIRIGDVTNGWRATVDGRAEELSRSGSGTLVLDLPGGARTSIAIERVDRSRAAWLTVQACVVVVFILWSLPHRRRMVDPEDSDT